MEDRFLVVGILIKDRIKEAGRTQKVLSKHARIIRTRLGFHEVSEAVCSRVGMILLQLKASGPDWQKMNADLSEIGGIEVKTMTFDTNLKT
ncbi:MAG: hypothetical protein R6U11_04785 [Bacteroidales bacterium]